VRRHLMITGWSYNQFELIIAIKVLCLFLVDNCETDMNVLHQNNRAIEHNLLISKLNELPNYYNSVGCVTPLVWLI